MVQESLGLGMGSKALLPEGPWTGKALVAWARLLRLTVEAQSLSPQNLF